MWDFPARVRSFHEPNIIQRGGKRFKLEKLGVSPYTNSFRKIKISLSLGFPQTACWPHLYLIHVVLRTKLENSSCETICSDSITTETILLITQKHSIWNRGSLTNEAFLWTCPPITFSTSLKQTFKHCLLLNLGGGGGGNRLKITKQ